MDESFALFHFVGVLSVGDRKECGLAIRVKKVSFSLIDLRRTEARRVFTGDTEDRLFFAQDINLGLKVHVASSVSIFSFCALMCCASRF